MILRAGSLSGWPREGPPQLQQPGRLVLHQHLNCSQPGMPSDVASLSAQPSDWGQLHGSCLCARHVLILASIFIN